MAFYSSTDANIDKIVTIQRENKYQKLEDAYNKLLNNFENLKLDHEELDREYQWQCNEYDELYNEYQDLKETHKQLCNDWCEATDNYKAMLFEYEYLEDCNKDLIKKIEYLEKQLKELKQND